MFEVLLIIGISLVLIAIFLPTLSKARRSAFALQCLSNLRMIGINSIVTTNASGRYPVASFSDAHGDAHSVGQVHEPGGLRQVLLPDVLCDGKKMEPGAFCCPSLGFTAERTAGEKKFETSGSYAYMCAHGFSQTHLSVAASPMRVFLGLYGPNGLKNNGSGSDVVVPEIFCVCGVRPVDIIRPSKTPLAFCDSFGVHGGDRLGPNWERGFLPKPLGGDGSLRVGGTNVVFADGHAENVVGTFDDMLGAFGLKQPGIREHH